MFKRIIKDNKIKMKDVYIKVTAWDNRNNHSIELIGPYLNKIIEDNPHCSNFIIKEEIYR